MENRKLFKCILISLFVLISVNFAYADSCIMISPISINKVDGGSAGFLKFHILSTLDNDKKSVIVTSLADGKGSFAIKTKTKKCEYNATVKDGKLMIKGDSTIKVLSIDLPPEIVQGEAE